MSIAVFSDTFEGEVLNADTPVLVDFWATWCPPCRALAPTIEKIAEQYAGRVKVVKVDTDRAPDISAQYGIQSIPTVMVFRGGKEAARWVGMRPLPAYTRELDGLLSPGA